MGLAAWVWIWIWVVLWASLFYLSVVKKAMEIRANHVLRFLSSS